jgi:hypothetical protein
MLQSKLDKTYPNIKDIFTSSETWLEFLVDEIYKISKNLINFFGEKSDNSNIFINFVNHVKNEKDLDKFYLIKQLNLYKSKLIELTNSLLIENKERDTEYFYLSEQFSRLIFSLKSFGLLENLIELMNLSYNSKKNDINLFVTKQYVSDILSSEAAKIQYLLENSLFFIFTNRREKKNLKILLESPYFYKTLALLYTKQDLKFESLTKISKIYQVDLSNEKDLVKIFLDTSNWSKSDALNLVNLGYKSFPTFLKFSIEEFGDEKKINEYLEIFYFLRVPVDENFEILTVFIEKEDDKKILVDQENILMKDSFLSNKDFSSFYPIYESSVLVDLYKNNIFEKITYLSHNAVNRKLFAEYSSSKEFGVKNDLGIYYYPIRVLSGLEINYELYLLRQKEKINKFNLILDTNESKEEVIFADTYKDFIKEDSFFKIFSNFSDFSIKFHNSYGDKKRQKQLIKDLLFVNKFDNFDINKLYSLFLRIYTQKNSLYTDVSYYRMIFSDLIKILFENSFFMYTNTENFLEKTNYFILHQENLKDFYWTHSITLVERKNRNVLPIMIGISYSDNFDTFSSYPFLNFLDYSKFITSNINRFQKDKTYNLYLPKLYTILLSNDKISIINYNKIQDFYTEKEYEVKTSYTDFNDPMKVEHVNISYMPVIPALNIVK